MYLGYKTRVNGSETSEGGRRLEVSSVWVILSFLVGKERSWPRAQDIVRVSPVVVKAISVTFKESVPLEAKSDLVEEQWRKELLPGLA